MVKAVIANANDRIRCYGKWKKEKLLESAGRDRLFDTKEVFLL
jgi:hypothetical protein